MDDKQCWAQFAHAQHIWVHEDKATFCPGNWIINK